MAELMRRFNWRRRMRGCVIQSGVERPSEYQFERGCLGPLAGHGVHTRVMESRMAKTLEAHDKLIRNRLRLGGMDRPEHFRMAFWNAPLTLRCVGRMVHRAVKAPQVF